MVFKNPYGFLIKHFRLIHLVLVFIYIYLAIKVNFVLQYYSDFVKGTVSKLDAISIISNYYLIAILVSIIVCVVIYAVLRYKKKPRLLYLLLMLFYIVVGGVIFIVYKGLEVIYFSIMETKTLLLYRDLLRILVLFQYISIFVVLIRGLGFDIKKFNFASDLQELNLNEKDEEEVELALGGTETLQRRFNRRVREFRYYYLENKVFIFLVIVVVSVIGIGSLFINKEVVNKVYTEGESVSYGSLSFQVLNTYVTNRDVYRNIITSDDTSFVVVKMRVGSSNKTSVNVSQLVLNTNYHNYTSDSRYNSKFLDLGYGYKNEEFVGDKVYLFIYRVDNKDLHHDMILRYGGGSDQKTVKLSGVYLDESSDSKEYNLNEKIDFSKTIFEYGYFMISSVNMEHKFLYSYEYEVMGKKNTASLSIGGDNDYILHLIIDCDLPFDVSTYSFLSTYGKLKYVVDDKEYISNLFKDKTPGSYKDGVYVSVDSSIEKASSIWIDFVIRNYSYKYILK